MLCYVMLPMFNAESLNVISNVIPVRIRILSIRRLCIRIQELCTREYMRIL